MAPVEAAAIEGEGALAAAAASDMEVVGADGIVGTLGVENGCGTAFGAAAYGNDVCEGGGGGGCGVGG